MSHRRGVEKALKGFYARNRRPFYFCKCGAEFLRAEKNAYMRHKYYCEEKEPAPASQPLQLGLFE